jgi:hypothetical protein
VISGSGVIALNREKWDFKSAIYYGCIVVGISGLIPKLAQFRRLFQNQWRKFLKRGDNMIPASEQ